MILVTFFKIPHRDRLAKNVKSRCVQVILRSTNTPTKNDKTKSRHTVRTRIMESSLAVRNYTQVKPGLIFVSSCTDIILDLLTE